jgi:hypothetical protein
MKKGFRIFAKNYSKKNQLKSIRLKFKNDSDYDTGGCYFYYIEKNETRIYVEYRRLNFSLYNFSESNFITLGLFEVDLINKKLTNFINFYGCWKDSKLLNYLGLEFLLDECINDVNHYIKLDFKVFLDCVFKKYTTPTDIIKLNLINNQVPLENFPMSAFKNCLSVKVIHWQNKVSRYQPIYYYLNHCLDKTMFFKHIHKLKKMNLVDMFIDAPNLGYKVNMKWSLKRIKLEHDNWSHQIREKKLLSEENEFLDPNVDYPTFNHSTLLTSKFGLVYEGQEMRHCVGGSGYWEKCKYGQSLIYKYHNLELKIRGTFELGIDGGNYRLLQFQTKGNKKKAPLEIKENLISEINNYKNNLK